MGECGLVVSGLGEPGTEDGGCHGEVVAPFFGVVGPDAGAFDYGVDGDELVCGPLVGFAFGAWCGLVVAVSVVAEFVREHAAFGDRVEPCLEQDRSLVWVVLAEVWEPEVVVNGDVVEVGVLVRVEHA